MIFLLLLSLVTLQWDANTEENLAGYNIYRSLESGANYDKLNTDLITVTQYEDVTPLPLTEYYYVATAIDTNALESGYSNEVHYVYACPGDVTMDGMIDVADSVLIMRYVVGLDSLTDPALAAADVNDDAIVDIADAVKINRSIVGLDSLEVYP